MPGQAKLFRKAPAQANNLRMQTGSPTLRKDAADVSVEPYLFHPNHTEGGLSIFWIGGVLNIWAQGSCKLCQEADYELWRRLNKQLDPKAMKKPAANWTSDIPGFQAVLDAIEPKRASSTKWPDCHCEQGCQVVTVQAYVICRLPPLPLTSQNRC